MLKHDPHTPQAQAKVARCGLFRQSYCFAAAASPAQAKPKPTAKPECSCGLLGAPATHFETEWRPRELPPSLTHGALFPRLT